MGGGIGKERKEVKILDTEFIYFDKIQPMLEVIENSGKFIIFRDPWDKPFGLLWNDVLYRCQDVRFAEWMREVIVANIKENKDENKDR